MASAIDNALQFHSRALELRAYRQELLASNVANADTPGYKARDIDFGSQLEQVLAQRTTGVAAERTQAAHLASAARTSGPGAPAYRNVLQPSIDGNTVDMDLERAQFADNAIHYEANLMFINGQLKALLAAIQG